MLTFEEFTNQIVEEYDCGCEVCSSIMAEDKKGHFRSTESGAGMTSKGVAAYNAKTGGNLKTAVTGSVKKGSKAAGRRKSFCARSKGWNGERGKAARRRWKC